MTAKEAKFITDKVRTTNTQDKINKILVVIAYNAKLGIYSATYPTRDWSNKDPVVQSLTELGYEILIDKNDNLIVKW